MRVVANGRPRDLEPGTSLTQLLEQLGLGGRLVVVERNGEALPRAAYDDVVLEDGDRLEIVRPLGGGAALGDARLYFVTPARIGAGEVADLVPELADAGVDMIQLREKETEALPLINAGERLRAACRDAGVTFIVNDRVDVALALDADGVHLGTHDLPTRHARRVLDRVVGRSTHAPRDIDDVLEAESPVDYIAVGPVFETPTKPGRPATGLPLLQHAAGRVELPWFAIGGIDETNVEQVIAAGARRIVVVRAVAEAADPPGAAARLRHHLDSAT